MEETMKPSNKQPVAWKTDFDRLTVSRFMERDVQYAHPETMASRIAAMMVEGFGAVPIVDRSERLLGVVSEHDLLGSLERGESWGSVTAKDIMTPNPYSVRPDTDLATLIHVLRTSGLIRVPVVVADDKLVGIVARRDIVRGYLNYDLDAPKR
jgi:CBS domain-containing protein